MTPRWLTIIFCLLLFPALLWNLGIMVFIDDEAIRALVAQEMIWSGDYLVPTMHGDPYLNKPPLWNWILTLSFRLWGGASEWATRFPTVISLLLYASLAYRLTKDELGHSVALLGSLSIITCGRMLFWDSMLGLIDVCFSGVVFTQFLLLWRYGERGQWWRAFGYTYALTALAFMLKGFPAIVFQGLTLMAYLVWRRQWQRLFSMSHIVSGLGCLALLATYYIPYSQEVSLATVWEQLFSESSKRTALAHSWSETLEHLALFPIEMSYHFLPWTLLLILFVGCGLQRRLREQPFLAYLLLVFLVNIPVYWLSPNVYPRYLLMLWPLIFFVGLALYKPQMESKSLYFRGWYFLLGGVVCLLGLAAFLIPFIPETSNLPYRWILAPVLGLSGLALGVRYWRKPIEGPMIVAVVLLLIRIALNGYVLPPRAAGDEKGIAIRASAERIGQTEAYHPLAIYGWSTMEPAMSYYLEMAYGDFVPRHVFQLDSARTYIVSPRQYPTAQGIVVVDSLFARHDNRPWYKVTDLRKSKLEAPNSAQDEYPMTVKVRE
ncbi:MAG: glycosyltransferase family 39 protein [Bacteroidota bacterium]